MSIIVYECDTCNRKVERQENPQGLDVMGRCVITNGCKGFLHKYAEKPLHIIPNIPHKVDGLDDWVQRKVLFTHDQTLQSNKWRVEHKLGLEPSVQVYVQRDELTLEEEDPSKYIIDIVDSNTITVTFEENVYGVAQCVGRSSSVGQKTQFIEPIITTTSDLKYQMSNNQQLTIGVAGVADSIIDVTLNFTQLTDINQAPKPFTIPFTNNIDKTKPTPWSSSSQVLIGGVLYALYTGDLSTINLNNQPHSVYLEMPGDSLDDTISLLTNSPFEEVDRNYEQYISLQQSSAATANASLLYQSGIMYGYSTVLATAFPFVRVTR